MIRGVSVETVRQFIDGKVLSQVVVLPEALQNALLEIIVRPVEEKTKPKITRAELEAMLPGSRTEALSGILKGLPEALTLEQIREERLTQKYGRLD